MFRNTSLKCIGAATLLACATLAAHSATTDETVKAIKDSFAKPGLFVVPESPAASLLGKSVAPLSRPQTVQQLAMEVAEIGEAASKSKGLSVSFAPAVLWGGKTLTIEKYRTDPLTRAWANTEISMGLTDPGVDATIARRAAVGLSWTAFDDGDPRRDDTLKACLNAAYTSLFNTPPPEKPGDKTQWEKAVAGIQSEVKKCSDASAVRQRSSSSLKLGLASGWANAPQTGGWRSGGTGLWLAGMYAPKPQGTDEPSRLRVLYRLQDSRMTDWSASSLSWTTEKTRGATLQARYDADKNGSDAILEIGVERDAKTSRNVKRVSLGLERQVMDGLWLVLSVTAKSGDDPSRPSTLILGKLKYAFGNDPILMTTDPSKP